VAVNGGQPTIRSIAVSTSVLAALVAGVGWTVGFTITQALLLATAATALGCLRLLARPGDFSPSGWPVHGDSGRDHGVRREVARLSWGLGSKTARVDRRSALRLRVLAVGRLAERGLNLDSAADANACRALLGDLAYDTLRADQRNGPHYEDFVGTLAAVDRIGPGVGAGATRRRFARRYAVRSGLRRTRNS
jgi:hypothetical protein